MIISDTPGCHTPRGDFLPQEYFFHLPGANFPLPAILREITTESEGPFSGAAFCRSLLEARPSSRQRLLFLRRSSRGHEISTIRPVGYGSQADKNRILF